MANFCPNCGSAVSDPSASFCPSCGAAPNAATAYDNTYNNTAATANNIMNTVGAAVAGALGTLVG